MNNLSATLESHTPSAHAGANEKDAQPRGLRPESLGKRTEDERLLRTVEGSAKSIRGHRARGLRRIVSLVAALLACLLGMAASPISAQADSRPATATVCFKSAYGWSFADATVYPQYLTTSGSYQPLNVSQPTNSDGCTTWHLTGGYSYRFFATNYSPGMLGSRSTGYSGAYTVWPGGSYHFGTWYVR